MIGNNLKYFRLAAGLSQDELAKKVGVTKMAISNYENNKRDADSKMLIKIADVLKIKVTNLLVINNYPLDVSFGSFRKKTYVSEEKKSFVFETIKRKLGNLNEIINILGGNVLPCINIRNKIDFTDVDEAVIQIRKFLSLPKTGPIGSIIHAIENKGIIICELDIEDDFSGINGLINGRPYIAINNKMSSEQKRFTLIHELVHILFVFKKELNVEKIIEQISMSFFFPKEDVVRELGQYRTDIRLDLIFLHREYNISLQSILFRAKQCNVISNQTYLFHQKWISNLNMTKNENKEALNEKSELLIKLIYRGVLEGLINENKASELLGYSYSKHITNGVMQ